MKLVVRNEKEAFSLLEKAISNQLGDRVVDLKFDGWPIVEIKLEGKGYEGTITSEMAGALVELQHAMNRTYARTVRHTANARTLTADERKDLMFKAKVEKGSSIIKVDLGDFVEKLAQNLVDKMGPEHLVATVIGLGIVGGSVVAYKSFLSHRSEDKKVSEESTRAIALSNEETRRMEILARAMKQEPVLDHARQDFDIARHEIVRGTADAGTLSVNGVALDRETARVIATAKRSESREIQLNGNYFIRKIDWQVDGEVRLTVGNADTAQVFHASFRDDSLDHRQTALLRDAEWKRSKIYLSINATELRGEITTASIVAVKEQPKDKAM